MGDLSSTAPASAQITTEPPVSLVPEREQRAREELELEQVLGREQLAVYLDAISRGLRKGRIELRRGDQALELAPCAIVELSLKGSENTKGGKLTIELSWSRSERASVDDSG
jgi:amphi-Trp domain-containing protein